jgi:hypothetical protein
MKALLTLAAACALSSCATTVTVSPAGGEPIEFTTGKDVRSTAKSAGLAFAAWYLQQLTQPQHPTK